MRRLRPNIIALTTIAGIVTVVAALGMAVVPIFGHSNPTAVIAAIAGLATTTNAGLLTLAGRIADDPPPPAYPASELHLLIAALREGAATKPGGDDDDAQ